MKELAVTCRYCRCSYTLWTWWCLLLLMCPWQLPLTQADEASEAVRKPSPADLAAIKLPPGFSLRIYHQGTLPGARSLALSGNSKKSGPVIVYVSSGSSVGNVYALVDSNGDGTADRTLTVLKGLDTPVGITWLNGSLYVAQFTSGSKGANGKFTGGHAVIKRYDKIDDCVLQNKPYNGTGVVIYDALPSDRSHALHYLRADPSKRNLYVPHGTPCNICETPKPVNNGTIHYAAMHVLNLQTRQMSLYATGIRNSVGFDWHPDTGVFYFTDNGRDQMGENTPDCELNMAPKSGMFFGFPLCQSEGLGDPYRRDPGVVTAINDPTLNANGARMNCSAPSSHTRPIQPLGPHTAPLGMQFYKRETGDMFPRQQYDRAIFIAEHGSWNRELLIGYRVSVARLDGGGGKVISYQTFMDCLQNKNTTSNKALCRPADVLQLPDGSLLVSDDKSNVVFRVAYDTTRQGR